MGLKIPSGYAQQPTVAHADSENWFMYNGLWVSESCSTRNYNRGILQVVPKTLHSLGSHYIITDNVLYHTVTREKFPMTSWYKKGIYGCSN
jgi:hypothetical protein